MNQAMAAGARWWRGSHPTVASLAGFYAGMVFIIVVPGLWGVLTRAVVGTQRAEHLFPYVLLTLLVPAALLVPRKTRRFAEFVWIGILSTAVVAGGVAVLVLWYLVNHG